MARGSRRRKTRKERRREKKENVRYLMDGSLSEAKLPRGERRRLAREAAEIFEREQMGATQ